MLKFRKISALILALALICALAVSAFAVTENVTCGSVRFSAVLDGAIDSATATVTMKRLDYLNASKYFSGSIVLHYVYCDETMVRPSYYEAASVTKNFTKYDLIYSNVYSISRGVTCSSGNVMIEASADYQMVEQTTSVTTTTTNTHLSLGLY